MMKTYHFIGIKGSGMSALALMLHQMGHKVQGSDVDNIISLSAVWSRLAFPSCLLMKRISSQTSKSLPAMPFVQITM